MRKPKDMEGHDFSAECMAGDSVLEYAPIIQICGSEIYSAKDALRLSKWLIKAAAWLEKQEDK